MLRDLRRVSIECPSIEIARKIILRIDTGSAYVGRRYKLGFARDPKDPNARSSCGYRDAQLNLSPAGSQLIFELQLHHRLILAIKTGLMPDTEGKSGHQRYVEYREIKETLLRRKEKLMAARTRTEQRLQYEVALAVESLSQGVDALRAAAASSGGRRTGSDGPELRENDADGSEDAGSVSALIESGTAAAAVVGSTDPLELIPGEPWPIDASARALDSADSEGYSWLRTALTVAVAAGAVYGLLSRSRYRRMQKP